MSFDKWSCLERAQNILSSGDDNVLRYACLELRFCIEAITYEKLNAYSNYVPSKVFEKWQPNHALKMLLQFEPDADENFSLYVSPESEPGKPTGNWINLGEHRTFRLGWLTKSYNRLGSYLHLRQKSVLPSEKNEELNAMRSALQEIASELGSIVNCDLIAPTLSLRIQFKCQVCDQLSLTNVDVLRQTGHAICINPHCGAEYHAVEDANGSWKFKLLAIEFKCLNCGQSNWLENRRVDIGTKFKCRSCGDRHVVIQKKWSYTRQSKVKDGS
jgi:DNA-directed RNA polymerase subunit RPC12/RpoP